MNPGRKRGTGRAVVRPFQPPDRPLLVRGIEGIQDQLAALDPFGLVHRGPGYGEAYVRHVLRMVRHHQGCLLVAERAGVPLGFVAAHVRPRDPLRDLELRAGRTGFVMDLYVEPPARGHGVGTTLLRAAERHLAGRGCSHVWLDVFVPNRRAAALYRSLGYAPFGTLMVAPLRRRRAPRPS